MTKLINETEKCKRDHLQDLERTILVLDHIVNHDVLTDDTTAVLARRILLLKLSRNKLVRELDGMIGAISLIQTELNSRVRKEAENV